MMVKCWRCRGDGYFWRVPDGFNPFSAGGWATARTMRKVHCFVCDGTGKTKSQLRNLPTTDSRKATDPYGGTGDSGSDQGKQEGAVVDRESRARPRPHPFSLTTGKGTQP